MAITSYSTLKTAIAAWAHRSDLTDVIDDFIDIAESHFNRELRVSQQETSTDLDVSTGSVDLPADCAAIRNIKLLTSPVMELVYVTPAEMDRLADNSTDVLRYTILADKIVLNAASSTNIRVIYYAKLTELSDSNTSNWLLETHAEAYLYGALAEVFKYSMDDEQAAKYAGMFNESIAGIKRLDSYRKSGQSMFVRVA